VLTSSASSTQEITAGVASVALTGPPGSSCTLVSQASRPWTSRSSDRSTGPSSRGRTP
jgi:hypothetical protein